MYGSKFKQTGMSAHIFLHKTNKDMDIKWNKIQKIVKFFTKKTNMTYIMSFPLQIFGVVLKIQTTCAIPFAWCFSVIKNKTKKFNKKKTNKINYSWLTYISLMKTNLCVYIYTIVWCVVFFINNLIILLLVLIGLRKH